MAGEGHFLAKITDFLHFDEMVGLGGGGRWGPALTFRLFRIRQLLLLFFISEGRGGLVGFGMQIVLRVKDFGFAPTPLMCTHDQVL